MSEELKPCPFCGESPILSVMTYGKEVRPCVSCENLRCSVSPCTEGFEMQAEAIAAWNKRASAAEEQVAVLRAALESVRWFTRRGEEGDWDQVEGKVNAALAQTAPREDVKP